MTLRTGEDTLIWRRKLLIALCGEIVLEEALDLSSDRILNEWTLARPKYELHNDVHILRRNCLLKQVIEGKIKEEMEVTRKRGRRRKKLLDGLKERRGYCHLKEEALDRTVWRAGFGIGSGPVVRQTDRWINIDHIKHKGDAALENGKHQSSLYSQTQNLEYCMTIKFYNWSRLLTLGGT